MIHVLQTVVLWATFVFLVLAPVLPRWTIWRAALAAALSFVSQRSISGPVGASDYGIGIVVVFVLQMALASVPLMAGRLILAAYQKRLTRHRFAGPGWVWPDAGLLDLTGFMLGVLLTIQLGLAVAPLGLGPWFDWTIG